MNRTALAPTATPTRSAAPAPAASSSAAVLALTAAGVLWGSSMALSKLSLEWLAPGWLTVVRFGLAALLLAIPARRGLKAAFTPTIVLWGILGVGVTVVVQNVGVGLTSVSHASMMVGSMPVLVAAIAAVWHRSRISPQAWIGLGISLLGVVIVAGGGGGSSSLVGDALVLFSLSVSAAMTVAQVGMLAGRDPLSVTAVQFMAASVGALPIALISEGAPAAPAHLGPVLGVLGLTVVGTLLPWVFFAFGQARVPAAVAGAFLNIEPLVGAVLGASFFGDALGLVQIAAGLTILSGVALSTMAPAAPARRRTAAEPQVTPAVPAVTAEMASLPSPAPAPTHDPVEALVLAITSSAHPRPRRWTKPTMPSMPAMLDRPGVRRVASSRPATLLRPAGRPATLRSVWVPEQRTARVVRRPKPMARISAQRSAAAELPWTFDAGSADALVLDRMPPSR